MRKALFVSFLFATSLFAQGGGQPRTIFIHDAQFKLGYGQTMSFDTGVTPASLQEYKPGYTIDGLYTLTFSEVNPLPFYPGYGEFKLSYGTQEVCSPDGWGIRNFAQVTFVCPSPGYLIIDHSLPGPGPAQGTHNLIITMTVPSGWPLQFEKVSLTFTPSN